MGLIIIEDVANQKSKHDLKHLYFEQNGIYWERYPLPVADYILANDKVLDVIARKQKRNMEVKKMDFLGTYNVAVDTKKDIQEIISNVCGQQHERFRDECILAQNNNIKLYVLIENTDGVKNLMDLANWHNPRLDIYVLDKTKPPVGAAKNGRPIYPKKKKYPKATSGVTLAKALSSMQDKYGVTFMFCEPNNSGAEIVKLLSI